MSYILEKVNQEKLPDKPARADDCWDCGGSGKVCPSEPDKCEGCEDCERCKGTGAEQ